MKRELVIFIIFLGMFLFVISFVSSQRIPSGQSAGLIKKPIGSVLTTTKNTPINKLLIVDFSRGDPNEANVLASLNPTIIPDNGKLKSSKSLNNGKYNLYLYNNIGERVGDFLSFNSDPITKEVKNTVTGQRINSLSYTVEERALVVVPVNDQVFYLQAKENNGGMVATEKIRPLFGCILNGNCEGLNNGETNLNCAQDCVKSAADGFCQNLSDSKCDPDCCGDSGRDPDCASPVCTVEKARDYPNSNVCTPDGNGFGSCLLDKNGNPFFDYKGCCPGGCLNGQCLGASTCNHNGICNPGRENSCNCNDCVIGSYDRLCLNIFDGICDPDCKRFSDFVPGTLFNLSGWDIDCALRRESSDCSGHDNQRICLNSSRGYISAVCNPGQNGSYSYSGVEFCSGASCDLATGSCLRRTGLQNESCPPQGAYSSEDYVNKIHYPPNGCSFDWQCDFVQQENYPPETDWHCNLCTGDCESSVLSNDRCCRRIDVPITT